MLSAIDQMRHSQIWDLLDTYADIRERLEDILYAMQTIQGSLESDLENLSDEFDDLTEQMENCSHRLIRFKASPFPPPEESPVDNAGYEELPFPEATVCDELPFWSVQEEDDSRIPWTPDNAGQEGGDPQWN